jgi:hypothetical protein
MLRKSRTSKCSSLNRFRKELVQGVSQIIKDMNSTDIQSLWAFSIKRWIETLKYGTS